MKEDNKDQKIPGEDDNTRGYPRYPDNEDIYEVYEEESEIDPNDVTKTKSATSNNALREQEVDNKAAPKDLDVPGSELDDSQEDIGSEDEENNYYSLGGDKHDDD